MGTHYKNSVMEEKYCKMPMSYPDDHGNKKAGLSAIPCEGTLHKHAPDISLPPVYSNGMC